MLDLQVYLGFLDGGRTVAVKKLNRSGMSGEKEFNIEANLLNELRHPNIVQLLGICCEGSERLCVLEYADRVGALSNISDPYNINNQSRMTQW